MDYLDVYHVIEILDNDQEKWLYNIAVENYSEYVKFRDNVTKLTKFEFFDRFQFLDFDNELENIENYSGLYIVK